MENTLKSEDDKRIQPFRSLQFMVEQESIQADPFKDLSVKVEDISTYAI
jgi:hypothetical protein